MMSSTPRFHRAARQRGAVLFIAMVVLVALAVAGLALLRSTDIAGLLAGNLSFKESALNATDLGFQKAVSLFPNTATINDSSSSCFFATQQTVDSRGVPSQLATLADTATYQGANAACTFTVSSTNETVTFLIDRLCTTTGVALQTDCSLAHKLPSGAWVGGSANIPTAASTFRVTVRVDGPRNTTAFSQIIGRQ